MVKIDLDVWIYPSCVLLYRVSQQDDGSGDDDDDNDERKSHERLNAHWCCLCGYLMIHFGAFDAI